MLYSDSPGVWILCTDISEHSVGSIFTYEDGTDSVFQKDVRT